MSDPSPNTPTKSTIFGHPKGLFVLFGAEMWERFSFYGMRALLTLYMVKVLNYNDVRASGVYAAYGALVYFFPVIGGLIAEKILGYRKAIILGGILMAIGHAVMAVEDERFFYTALAFLCVGNGFFKPNISSTVGKLYEPGDGRRDAGFTIFYMGVNLGGMLAPFVCGPLGEGVGWHFGFGAAAIGMLLGLVVFIRGTSALEGRAEPRNPAIASRYAKQVWIGSLVAVPVFAGLLRFNEAVHVLVPLAFVGVLITMFLIAQKETRVGRDQLYALMILMVFHIAFWAFFEQAGSSLTLFTDRCVNRVMPLFGERPASWFQGVNGTFILLLAIPFSILWTKLGELNRQPSIPAKFAIGLVHIGFGFGVLALGATLADEGERTSWIFLILLYLLNTMGELCLSPVGLSAVTKLAPERHVGFIMGGWMLTISMGHTVAGEIAKLTNVSFEPDTLLQELTANQYRIPESIDGGKSHADLLGSIEKGADLKAAVALPELLESLDAHGVTPEKALEELHERGLFPEQSRKELANAIEAPVLKDTTSTVEAMRAYTIGPVTEVYSSVYRRIAAIAFALSLLLMLLVRPIRKLMHGVE